ncbi:MAG TPA: HEAT repeat domain-containing protein [Candidatus Hydrogenedentes bacterium]|nr:HEAT repeat domain-containing protein [Candidatus Hydrogenedentota bacterium]
MKKGLFILGLCCSLAVLLLTAGSAVFAEESPDSAFLGQLGDEMAGAMKQSPTEAYVGELLEKIRRLGPQLEPDGSGSKEDAARRLELSAITDYFGRPDMPAPWREQAASTYGEVLAQGNLSPSARAFLCEQIRRIGTARETAVLAGLLEDPQTAEAACMALESIGGPEACQVLLDALNKAEGAPAHPEGSSPSAVKSIRARLILSLGAAGCADSVALLKGYGNDPELRAPARGALCAIGDPDAAAWCLSDLEAAGDDAARAAVTADLTRLAERLRISQPDQAAELARKMQSSSYGPCRVAGALLEAGLIESGEKRSAWLARRIQQPDAADDPAMWGVLLAAAGDIPGDGAAKAWADLLKRKNTPAGLRRAVAAMLARRGDETSVKAVARAAADKDPEVRAAAMECMNGKAAVRAGKSLLKHALQSEESRERRAAWDALLRTGDPEIHAMAARSLARSNDRQRAELLGFLGNAGAAAQAGAVMEYISAPDETTALAALKAVAQLGDNGQWDGVLGTLLQDAREPIRRAAVDTLSAIWNVLDDTRRRARSRDLARRFGEADETGALALAPLLGRLDSAETRTCLLEQGVSRQDAPVSLRVAAAESLGRNAPECAAALAERIGALPVEGGVRGAALDALVSMLRADFGRAQGAKTLGLLAGAAGAVDEEHRAALVKAAGGAGMAGLEALEPLLDNPEWAGAAAQVIADMVRGDNRRPGIREAKALEIARKALPLLDAGAQAALQEALNSPGAGAAP